MKLSLRKSRAQGHFPISITAYLLALLFLMIGSCRLYAGDWLVSPSVAANGIYSDNIGLAPSGQEQSSFVAEVIPQLSIRREGRRLDLGFDYDLQTLLRTRQDEADVFNQFAGDAKAELLRDWLFLDFVTTYTQQNILATDLGGDNIANRGDRTNVFTYSVSPFVAHRLGTFGTAEARFTHAGVDNFETFDTTSDNINLQFLGGTDFQRVPWRIFYEQEKNTPSEGEDSKFLRTGAELGYQIISQFRVFAVLGYEKNDFISTEPESQRNGFSWSSGAMWTPHRRTRIEGGYSVRPFGGSFFADLSYLGARTTWQATYSEDFSTTTQAQLAQQSALVTDSVAGQADAVAAVVPPPSLVVEEVFLSRRFEGSLGYLWRRSDGTLSLFAEERSFETTGGSQRVYGGTLAARRELSRSSTLSVLAEMQRIRDSVTRVDNTFWRAGLQLSRAVNRYVSGSVDYSYQQQRSDIAVDDYTENRVTVGVMVTFQPRKL